MTVEGSAGGGAVTAVVDGHGQLISLAIGKEVVDRTMSRCSQDLVTAAVNDGLHRVKQTMRRWPVSPADLRIPGMF